MRVLQVVPSLDPITGGPARSVPALCRALRATGVDVALYTFRPPGGPVSVAPNREPFPIRWFRPLPGSRQLPTWAFYRQLRREVAGFDLVHLHSLWNPAVGVAALACRRAGVPYLVSPLGMLQEGALRRRWWLKRPYHWLWERRTIAGACLLHFFTAAEAADSRRLAGDETPIALVPSGMDPADAAGARPGRFRAAHPGLRDKRILLFLGRLHWSKGLDVQLEALALLVREFPDLVWVLVGPDEGERGRLSRRIGELGVARHVLWTGLLPRTACLDALADADVFLLTSRHEAHSTAMNEALAVGVPTVLTDTVGFDEVAEWGAGRVVPRDPEQIAAAIRGILLDPERAGRMREAGRRLVDARLAWPSVTHAMLDAYADVIAAHQRTSPQPRPRGSATRVLHVIPSLDPRTGGPARSVPALCRALRATGVDVALYTFRPPGGPVSVAPNREPFPIRWFRPLPGSRQLPTWAFYRQLRREVAGFDLVHLHSLWNPAVGVAALACRRAGVPYLVSPRGMLQEGALRRRWWLKRPYHWLWERRTIAGACLLHFFTAAEAADSRRLAGDETPIALVPSGMDPADAAGARPGRFRAAHPGLRDKRILLFLGRLHWSKGLDVQLEALALLVREFPDLVWVLVGPDEGERGRLSRRIGELGVARHVLWTGLLPRTACLDALADADVFLLTSRHEAHSTAMNEALAVGVPTVLTDTVGFDEVAEWGAGRVVPRDPEQIAAAIRDILLDPERAGRMREAGRRLVDARLAWPSVTHAMLDAYAAALTTEHLLTRSGSASEDDNVGS